jgi:hypothetical protein
MKKYMLYIYIYMGVCIYVCVCTHTHIYIYKQSGYLPNWIVNPDCNNEWSIMDAGSALWESLSNLVHLYPSCYECQWPIATRCMENDLRYTGDTSTWRLRATIPYLTSTEAACSQWLTWVQKACLLTFVQNFLWVQAKSTAQLKSMLA